MIYRRAAIKTLEVSHKQSTTIVRACVHVGRYDTKDPPRRAAAVLHFLNHLI